ncbi:MAG: alpha/beta hydrolase [Acholeplasma sp.]|nr:alpha/beta hydrolase [Acholeplasma sp.]
MKAIKIVMITLLSSLLLLVGIVSALFVFLTSTPNLLPFTLRQVWNKEELYELKEYLSIKDDIEMYKDLEYPSKYGENKLDIYFSKTSETAKPVIIWIHGGAFVSGDKSDLKVFGSMMAAEGFTFIAINYELAPESHFPRPLIQVSEVIQYLSKMKYEMIDLEKVIIGGDSAGAHIAANFAALQTNEELSEEMKIKPVINKDFLKGVLLYCGPFDLKRIDNMIGGSSNSILNKVLGYSINQIGWHFLVKKIGKKKHISIKLISLIELMGIFLVHT